MSKAEVERFPHRWFPRKQYIPLISIKKGCGLTYHERLVYSFLVYRWSQAAKKKGGRRSRNARSGGATQKKIAERLGIDRGETVRKLLERLVVDAAERPRLVEERNDRYYARQPSGATVEWFAHNRRKNEPWYGQFSTFPVFIPSKKCPLTAKVNGLLWLMWSLAPRWGKPVILDQNQKGLAVLTGTSRKFVRSALETLQGHRLVKSGTLAYFMLQPSAEQLAWWRDRPAQKDRNEARKFVLSEALGWKDAKVQSEDASKLKEKQEDSRSVCKRVDQFAAQMLEAGYAEKDIVAYWRDVLRELGLIERLWTFTFVVFEELFLDAERVHGESGYARSSIGILRSMTPEAVENVKAGRI